MRRDTETKYINQLTNVHTGFNAPISGFDDIQYATPSITKGTGPFNRIGQSITPTKCYVDFDIGFAREQPNSFDYNCHLYMLRCKGVKAYINRNSIPINNLLDDSLTSQLFDGYPSTAMLPVEKNNFTVLHHKKFRLTRLAGSSIAQNAENIHCNKRIRLAYKSKKLVYDDTLDSGFPSNDLVIWVFGYTPVRPDEAPPFVGTPIQITSRVSMYFKDD